MSTNLTVKATSKPSGETALILVGNKSTKAKKDFFVKGGPAELVAKANELFKSEELKGEWNEIFVMRSCHLAGYKNVVFAGLGDVSTLSNECLRKMAGHLSRDLHLKTKNVDVFFDNLSSFLKDKAAAVEAFTEASIMGSYKFQELRSTVKRDDLEKDQVHIHILGKNKTEQTSIEKSVTRGTIIAESVNFARRLGDLPGNIMTPTELAKQTTLAAKGTGIKVSTWDFDKIVKEKMGNFAGVAKGSDEPCKFIIMEYKGAGTKQKPVCFVGKGLTFDSGGTSLKPGAGMEEMKYDMCGGANVIAATIALAKMKAKINILTFVPATENMMNGKATKPGDVTTARNGKTTEVNNTDAEGRLILSDALVYACEHKPSFIVDAATLTGAMTIALGDTHTGYFTTNEKLKKAVEAAAEDAGERIWQLPLVKEHIDDMKGTYGDLSNISYNKGAGSAKGAGYLHEFVDKDIPWAHFDIASTAWNIGGRYSYHPKKLASGVMIRTFINLALNWK